MITGSFSNEEIMQAIEDEIEDEVIKSEFSVVVFSCVEEEYTVGLFINGLYILECDVFETETMDELKFKMREIGNLIYNKYGVRSTYNIFYEDGRLPNINDEKVS
jgi:hypothetical protein